MWMPVIRMHARRVELERIRGQRRSRSQGKPPRQNKPRGRKRVSKMCASLPALLPHSLFCAAVAEEEAQGPQSEQRRGCALFATSLFSVSRCLSEPCAAIDLAGCRRTSANGGD